MMTQQTNRLNGAAKIKYFKPGEFLHNASNFSKRPAELQHRQSSFNMINEAKMKQSLQKTLRQTDVWKNDALLFKLNGSGVNNGSRLSQYSRTSAHSAQGSRIQKKSPPKLKGHNPTSTMRDKGLFS